MRGLKAEYKKLMLEIPAGDSVRHAFDMRLLSLCKKLLSQHISDNMRFRNMELHLDGHVFKKKLRFNKYELKEFFATDSEFPDGEGFEE